MSRISRIALIVGGGIVGAIVALILAGGGGSTHSTTTVIQQGGPPAEPTSFSGTQGLTINQIYKQASPGVVDITVVSNTGGFGFFGGGGQQQQTGEGAGVVYDTNGDILTDEHVVTGATSVTVNFQNGRKVSGRVLGTDPSTDVAVVRVSLPASQLHPIPLANSSAAQVGDPVVAIGSPFSLPETVTSGIVSQVNRSITAPNNYTIPGAIQTDAPINPGNSGGPLLDAKGRVLGLNDQIQTNSGSNAGVGFAIPSNTVAQIAQEIIGGHKVQHAYVGVELVPGNAGGAQVATQPDQQGNQPIASGSPADQAGLKPGDVITAIDGKPVNSTDQFIATINGFSPGQTVTMTIKRGGQTLQLKVKLGTRPNTAPSAG